MRLIDADLLIEGRVENDPVVIAARCAPTAYDPEKIIVRLEEEETDSAADFELYANEHGLDGDYDDFYYMGLKRAIEIVKGGIDDRV